MHLYSLDDIRKTFSSSTDFNEIFDVFQSAVTQQIKDVELYRLLFWNQSLTADEIRLFGEKLATEFHDMAFDVYLWLASVFEVTTATDDNYELAVHYYQKAALIRPSEPDPYLDACDCYDPDLNIPPSAYCWILSAAVLNMSKTLRRYTCAWPRCLNSRAIRSRVTTIAGKPTRQVHPHPKNVLPPHDPLPVVT